MLSHTYLGEFGIVFKAYVKTAVGIETAAAKSLKG